MTVSSDEQSLELVAGIPDPTRTRGYGSGRVDFSRVGLGRVRVRRPRVRVYPVLPVKNTILEREPFDFCMFSKLLMMKQLQYGT